MVGRVRASAPEPNMVVLYPASLGISGTNHPSDRDLDLEGALVQTNGSRPNGTAPAWLSLAMGYRDSR